MLFDAANAEAVRDFLVRRGFMQFTNFPTRGKASLSTAILRHRSIRVPVALEMWRNHWTDTKIGGPL
jgi:hypothetical protein